MTTFKEQADQIAKVGQNLAFVTLQANNSVKAMRDVAVASREAGDAIEESGVDEELPLTVTQKAVKGLQGNSTVTALLEYISQAVIRLEEIKSGKIKYNPLGGTTMSQDIALISQMIERAQTMVEKLGGSFGSQINWIEFINDLKEGYQAEKRAGKEDRFSRSGRAGSSSSSSAEVASGSFGMSVFRGLF